MRAQKLGSLMLLVAAMGMTCRARYIGGMMSEAAMARHQIHRLGAVRGSARSTSQATPPRQAPIAITYRKQIMGSSGITNYFVDRDGPYAGGQGAVSGPETKNLVIT